MNSPNTPININDYLTIEALEDGLYVYLSVNSCEYCIDGDGNWKSLPRDTATTPLKKGQTLSFRGNLTPNSFVGIGCFTISKSCNLKGNVMSMLFGDKAKDNYSLYGYAYAFSGLFYYCTTIKTVSNNFLPATTLASYCYHEMFSGCTSLTTAPDLPAEELKNNCYSSMFNESGVNYIKALFKTIPGNSFTNNWVRNVPSTGIFVKNPEATWEVYGNSGIPNGWTVKFDGEEEYGEEITFYLDTMPIGGYYTLTAREGMTWADWVESEYNTIGVELYEGEEYTNVTWNGLIICDYLSGSSIKHIDKIISEETYGIY